MQSTPTFDRAAAPARPVAARGRLVIDAPTRMFHWLFALAFLGAWVTADGERWRALHVTLGYTLAGLLVFRVLYGLLGPRRVRIGLVFRRLGGARKWLDAIRQRRSLAGIDWRQGQNLLMALAIAALLVSVVPLTLSGYAVYDDWGGEWLEEMHEFFGNAFLALVLAHLVALAGSSLLARRNQALPMLTGRVTGRGPDLVERNRSWLAALMLIAVVAFAAWQWQQAPDGLVPASAWSGSMSDDDDDD